MVMNHHAASSTEPPRRLVDRRLADGQQAVVRQDHRLVSGERLGDPLALLEIEHHAAEVLVDAVVAIEHTRVLGQRIEGTAQRGPRLPVHRVRVRGGHDIGPCRVNLGVDRERGAVHRPVAVDDLALRVDEQEVADPDALEVHPERIDPEVVEVLRVTGGDVAGGALVEAEVAEHAECGREPLFAVPALVVDVVEGGELHWNSV
jgi:hypothetical protein